MPAFPVASCHQGLLDAFCQKDSWLKKEKTLQKGARLSVLDAELRDGVSQTQEPWLRSQLFLLYLVPWGTSSRPQSAPRVGGCWEQSRVTGCFPPRGDPGIRKGTSAFYFSILS